MPKPPGQRYVVDAKPAKGSTWVRLGRAHYTQSIVEASFKPLPDDDCLPTVWMLVALDPTNNSPQVYDIKVSASGTPLTPTSIRVPLRSMARAALACFSYRQDGETAHLVAVPGDTFVVGESTEVEHLLPERLRELEREFRATVRRSPKPRITDDTLREVGEVHAASPRGERRVAIARHFQITEHTAKAWTKKARDRGFLGPT